MACAEMYFMGVSTRKVKNVLEKMGGFELSAGTVSCVAQELDERLTEFRQRRQLLISSMEGLFRCALP